jgi:hypothetical protein
LHATHVQNLCANETSNKRRSTIRAMSFMNGKPAAYFCQNFTCKAPGFAGFATPDPL